ncbi:hypothetical protein [Pseudonocardia sp. ICBG1142]|uniref:hypothetical protein n=1 Tax=Pseudonocardia sp. ICBG1142 TaxID=2846760 RepID=UPI001CF71C21|nr:hypothetical protein [Pseudonocardia sp. ICBG1142]
MKLFLAMIAGSSRFPSSAGFSVSKIRGQAPQARDYERHTAVSEAMIRWAAINTIARRIARGTPAHRQQKHTSTPSI